MTYHPPEQEDMIHLMSLLLEEGEWIPLIYHPLVKEFDRIQMNPHQDEEDILRGQQGTGKSEGNQSSNCHLVSL